MTEAQGGSWTAYGRHRSLAKPASDVLILRMSARLTRPQIGTGDGPLQGAGGAEEAVVGIALWASGETVWLLDLVAADRRQATLVLAKFRQLAGDRPVKIAPVVAG